MMSERILLASCLVSAVFFGVASFPGVFASVLEQKKRQRDALVEKGREVYAANCANCHGADGRGKTQLGEAVEAPDLTDAAWRKKVGASRMAASVARGRGRMPGFDRALTREEIAAVVAYVRALKK
jgi:cbb3-type cytochrome c oxidase subunit III